MKKTKIVFGILAALAFILYLAARGPNLKEAVVSPDVRCENNNASAKVVRREGRWFEPGEPGHARTYRWWIVVTTSEGWEFETWLDRDSSSVKHDAIRQRREISYELSWDDPGRYLTWSNTAGKEGIVCFTGNSVSCSSKALIAAEKAQALADEIERKRRPEPGKPFTNSIGMKLVYIPPGEFMMGSRNTAQEIARRAGSKKSDFTDEYPQHQIKITNGFFMGSTEVTQAQYVAIMGKNPSNFKGEDNPVERVDWFTSVEFCRRLSKKEGKKYRLPTEAEWEYACRAGTTTPFDMGETISTDQANYDGTYVYDHKVMKRRTRSGPGYREKTSGIFRRKTISVGSFPANAFGLYDMHGNVWEWCQDWYGKVYYETTPATDPQGPSTGVYCVNRGGSWQWGPRHCRSADRGYLAEPWRCFSHGGFRIVLDLN